MTQDNMSTARIKKIQTPADYVINTIGGVRKTAKAIGRTPAAVSMWRKPANKGGTGGEIPRIARRLILEYARQNDLPITPYELELGRVV